MSNSLVSVVGGLQNKLLGALPDNELERVQPYLSLIQATAGETLCESHRELDYGYFPITSIISILHITTDGASTKIATIGNEGLVGINLFLDVGVTANRVVVQSGGYSYRLKRRVLQEEFSRGGAMQHLLLRYTQALFTQIAQSAVCNRRHTLDQQLCRWLLHTMDRLASQELTMTHELLAHTLGVRREGITEAALKLQSAGLINYRRGHITVLNRSGVEACCCECYRVVRRAFDRLAGARTWTLSKRPHAATRQSNYFAPGKGTPPQTY